MVLMDEHEQEYFPEFEEGATLSDDLGDDAFFSGDDAFSEPIQDDFYMGDEDAEGEEESTGSSPVLAMVMVGVIFVFGCGWFLFQDNVDALEDVPNNYLNDKWASEAAQEERLSPASLIAERKKASKLEGEIAELEAELDSLDAAEQDTVRLQIQERHEAWKAIMAKLPRPVDVEWTIPKSGAPFPEASDMNAALADGAEVADVDVSDDQADPADDSVEEQSAQSDSESAQPDVIANANSKKAPSAAQRKRDEKALEAPKSSEAQKKRSSELAAEALRLYNQSDYKGAAGRYEKALAMGPGSFPSSSDMPKP